MRFPLAFSFLLFLFICLSSAVAVVKPEDVSTPLEDLEMRGVELAPSGSDSLLALDNVVKCYARTAPRELDPDEEPDSFGETNAIAAKNLLLNEFRTKSDSNANLPPDEMVSQSSQATTASAINMGLDRIEIDIPLRIIDQAFRVIIEYCVKRNNMTGSLASRGEVHVAILELHSSSRSARKTTKEATTEDPQTTDDKKEESHGLRIALLFGLFGILSLYW